LDEQHPNCSEFALKKKKRCFSAKKSALRKQQFLTKSSHNAILEQYKQNKEEISYKINCFDQQISSELDQKKKKSICLSNANKTKIKQFLPQIMKTSRDEFFIIDKEIQNKNKFLNLNLYKIMTEELENHLTSSNNGLALLKKEFTDFFMKSYCNSQAKIFNKIEAENILNGLKTFIIIFTECLMFFYKLEELAEYLRKSYKSQTNYFKFDNFFMFITNLFFNEEIYDFIYNLQKNIIDEGEEAIFAGQLEKIKGNQIEDFEIPVQYTLNENTAKILTKSFETKLNPPYINLINSLNTIGSLKSPFFQFKRLNNISESIAKEINEFYEGFQSEFKEFIDTDTFIALHIYIIAKSNVNSLSSILSLIEKFSSERQKMEVSGYYLTIYKAGVEYIKSL